VDEQREEVAMDILWTILYGLVVWFLGEFVLGFFLV